MNRPLSIFMIAGEPSGDLLGARLMAALRELTGGAIEITGIGGEAMRGQGLESLFPMEELSIMGIAEILPHLPSLLRRIRETADAIDKAAPDALITIDSPDFTRRVARRISDRAIPRIHYVAPTVWAWRPWRAKGFARDFTHLLALLPFEPPWFERAGLPCSFVGHPVLESGADKGDGPAFRLRHDIAAEDTLICVLPGSRRGEVGRLARDFGGALEILAERHPSMRVVVPTIEAIAPVIREITAGWKGSPVILLGARERYDAMAAANAALAASGTVSLELALARLPTVIAYRMAPLTHFLVRRLVSVDYASLVNIIEGREVVPELLQDDCRPDGLADALERVLGPEGRAQVEAVQPALAQLGLGGEPPGRRAAQAVLDIIARSGT
jgi:lipid-A-disaccharide synthase